MCLARRKQRSYCYSRWVWTIVAKVEIVYWSLKKLSTLFDLDWWLILYCDRNPTTWSCIKNVSCRWNFSCQDEVGVKVNFASQVSKILRVKRFVLKVGKLFRKNKYKKFSLVRNHHWFTGSIFIPFSPLFKYKSYKYSNHLYRSIQVYNKKS